MAERVEAGGHVLLDGVFSRYEMEEEQPSRTIAFGGIAGGSIHFRSTPLFGVRLGFELLHAGHWWSEAQGATSEATFAELTANFHVKLTFRC